MDGIKTRKCIIRIPTNCLLRIFSGSNAFLQAWRFAKQNGVEKIQIVESDGKHTRTRTVSMKENGIFDFE